MIRWITIPLLLLPLISFAEVRITSYNVELSNSYVFAEEPFTLTINIKGVAKPFHPNQYSLSYYPKKLKSDMVHLTNVKIEHSITTPSAENRFQFKLIFYFKAIRPGDYVIPNFQIGFTEQPPLLTIPKQNITILRSLFVYTQPVLISMIFILLLISLYYMIKLFGRSELGHLKEIHVYYRFTKLRKKLSADFSQKLRRLLAKYIHKKCRLKFRVSSLEFDQLPVDDFLKQKLNQLWVKTDSNSWDDNRLSEVERLLKTILFLFQNTKIVKREQYE